MKEFVMLGMAVYFYNTSTRRQRQEDGVFGFAWVISQISAQHRL
jgi:hypothetical protein